MTGFSALGCGVPDPAAPDPAPSFAALGVPAAVVTALHLDAIDVPTPVQAAVVPDALAGHDVLARARTGSGKTLAFGIPLVARLAGSRSRMHRPRALVVVPTRELASQVEQALRPVAKALRLRLATIYGGTRYDAQVAALRRATDIVVGTPGRLQDLIDKGVLKTDDVVVTVLDEADHLCDLGFHPAVDRLLSATPARGQRLLLSATLDGDVDALVRTHLRDPRRHEVDATASVSTMSHHVVVVAGFAAKVEAAHALVAAHPRAVVFTRTREGATDLRAALERRRAERRRPPRRPVPARPRAQPGPLRRRPRPGRGRHRRRGPRHPRRRHRDRRPLRPADRPEGLPAPLRAYGARG